MDDDSGAKASVTRLRRRLSVEQPEVTKSPGPATPTKKRGGRLAAKPELEFIDENSPTSATKRSTKKTAVKNLTGAPEDKPLTPARRSARIKSNTSIAGETTQSFDDCYQYYSPRAKRAARRNSQVGSDTETSVTPAKQPRRTRKDSASSMEILETALSTKPYITYTEVIIEETDSNQNVQDKNNDNISLRKSPRLRGNKQKQENNLSSSEKIADNSIPSKINDLSVDQKDEVPQEISEVSIEKIDNKSSVAENPETCITHTEVIVAKANSDDNLEILEKSPSFQDKKKDEIKEINSSLSNEKNELIVDKEKVPQTITGLSLECKSSVTDTPHNDLSNSNINKQINKKKKSSNANKSTSAIEKCNEYSTLSGRQRSQSLSSVNQLKVEYDIAFHSDNERLKKTTKSVFSNEYNLNMSGSGDGQPLNKSNNLENVKTPINELNVSKNEKDYNENVTGAGTPTSKRKSLDKSLKKTKSLEENLKINYFEKLAVDIVQSTMLFKDLSKDGHTDIKHKSTETLQDSGDQCVPVVESGEENKREDSNHDSSLPGSVNKDINPVFLNSLIHNKSDIQPKHDISCEPMDVDETLSNTTFQQQDHLNNDGISQKLDSSLNISNNAKRKSSISLSNLDKTSNENKSTLIISHVKDVSAENSVCKSPDNRLPNDVLSKSIKYESVKHNNNDKKKLSIDYSTSTPLQQKKNTKLGMQINTSIIDTSANISKKSKQDLNISNRDVSRVSKKSDISSSSADKSDNETSDSNSNLLDDEADVASDDYESGDSRDEDSRQYEIENEILEKGHTLDSEDEISNDSDYEKDSFVVSANEDDEELLSGSGDDLSMSNNELTMSKKSKNKYNERKLKQQKKASKEMFDARHEIDKVKTSLKKKSRRINSSSSTDHDNIENVNKQSKIKSLSNSFSTDNFNEEEISRAQTLNAKSDSEDDIIMPVKKNKHQRLNSTHDDSLEKCNSATKSKKKRSSKSENNELEMTSLFEGSISQTDPLSSSIKMEPKTPSKSFDISTVQIYDNIKEVEVDNNISILKSNESQDPLQTTVCKATDEDGYLSISEDSEKMNDYESVLNKLNNEKIQVKNHDISLNLIKKTKKKSVNSIVDHLNLTDITVHKKRNSLNKSHNNQQEKKTVYKDTDGSSDSIDLQLLFSADSNDFEQKTKKQSSTTTGASSDFIPLKRTVGKIDILKEDTDHADALFLETINTSAKNKKNKKKSVNKSSNEIKPDVYVDEQNDGPTEILNLKPQSNIHDEIKFIVDTEGTVDHAEALLSNTNNTSAKKKKSLNKSSNEIRPEVNEDEKDHDGPTEVSNLKPQSNIPDEIKFIVDTEGTVDHAEALFSDTNNTSAKKKKNKKKSLNKSSNETRPEVNVDEKDDGPIEVPFQSTANNKFNNSTACQDTTLNKNRNNDSPVNELSNSKKRKRTSSVSNENIENELLAQSLQPITATDNNSKQKKKMKLSDKNDSSDSQNKEPATGVISHKKKKKSLESAVNENSLTQCIQVSEGVQSNKNKKRKREDDCNETNAKVLKNNSFDKVQVKRLPASILSRLDQQLSTNEVHEKKKSNIVSTTSFIVEESRKRKNKPSNFLEDSVYLNENTLEKKQNSRIKKPKVLPFVPTATTSGSGFTTNFKINIIPQKVEFTAQTKNEKNFKNNYLYSNKIKRLGTFEKYKKYRSAKMSKF